MFTYSSFSASDEELDASTLSPEGSSGSADTGGLQASKPTSKKRMRKDDDNDQRPRQRRKLEPLPVSADQIAHLACPFAKHDPLRHRRCFKYKMDQISRLKQHLFRVHQVPIHCVRCSQTFGSEEERDSHLRSISGCEIQPNQTWVGINETQKTQLAQRVSSKRSKEENWYSVYKILFPGEPRPASPYQDGTQFSEELFAIREYAMRKAPSIISQLTCSTHHDVKGPPAVPAHIARLETLALAAVKNTFDTVIDQWLRGNVPVHGTERPDEASSDAAKETVPTTGPGPQFVNPWETTTERDAKPKQNESTPSENAILDHGATLMMEGTKTLAGVDEPSGLDWLSMVANMDTTWDDYLMGCIDNALQQPLK